MLKLITIFLGCQASVDVVSLSGDLLLQIPASDEVAGVPLIEVQTQIEKHFGTSVKGPSDIKLPEVVKPSSVVQVCHIDFLGLAFVSANNTVQIIAAESGEVYQTFPHPNQQISNLLTSPKGTYLATISYVNYVRVFEVSTGNSRWDFDDIVSFEFSPDEKHLAAVTTDGTASIFCLKSGGKIKEFQEPTGEVQSISFSQQGICIATVTYGPDFPAKVFNVHTGEELELLRGHTIGKKAIFFSPDDRFVMTRSNDNTLRLFRRDESSRPSFLKGLFPYSLGDWTPIQEFNDDNFSFSNNGEHIAFQPSGHVFVSLYSLERRINEKILFPTLWRPSPLYTPSSLSFSPGGEYVAVGYTDGHAGIFETASGKQWKVIKCVYGNDVPVSFVHVKCATMIIQLQE